MTVNLIHLSLLSIFKLHIQNHRTIQFEENIHIREISTILYSEWAVSAEAATHRPGSHL